MMGLKTFTMRKHSAETTGSDMTQVFLEASHRIQPSTDVPHLSLLYEP